MVLSIDQIVSLSTLEDPELAQRALGHTVPSVLSKIAQAARDQGLAVDWTTFSLAVDTADVPYPLTAVIRTSTHAS